MRLWRISDFHDLRGLGGMKASARWHTRGSKIVYLSDSSPGALLEVLVHLEIDGEDIPDGFSLIRVESSPELQIAELVPPTERDWRLDLSLTRAIGDAWLKGGETALAKVPSSIIGESCNYLFNPLHPLARQLQIKHVTQERFDPRLFRFGVR